MKERKHYKRGMTKGRKAGLKELRVYGSCTSETGEHYFDQSTQDSRGKQTYLSTLPLSKT